MTTLTHNPAPTCSNEDLISVKEIAEHCKKYNGADTKRSMYQLVTTLALFAAALYAMICSVSFSYFLTLLLAVPTGGLLVRIFIFQHDCGHGSFFKSKNANDWLGRGLSLLTFTPYDFWRKAHNMHHATSGDLDRRSIGGIDTITVKEFYALPKSQQFAYRLYRNPFLLFFIGTPLYVLVAQRIPFKQLTKFHDEYHTLPLRSTWKSILLTDISLILVFGSLGALVGYGTLIALYLPVLLVATWVGGWLFYVQHQFEDAYWEKSENWNRQEAALLGSSYYVLPKVIQWFVGNIGLHHIHHLCSTIPNYKLQECMDAEPTLETINRLTFLESLKCVRLKLWDEEKGQLVTI